jgi:hypothetical protein
MTTVMQDSYRPVSKVMLLPRDVKSKPANRLPARLDKAAARK